MKRKQRKYNKWKKILFIRKLKIDMTQAELEMCRLLRKLGVAYKFQRWFKGTKYVADFWLPIRTAQRKKLGLIIEVDGEYHEARKSYDRFREQKLLRRKNRVDKIVRFTNEEVLSGIDKVKAKILAEIESLRQNGSPLTKRPVEG